MKWEPGSMSELGEYLTHSEYTVKVSPMNRPLDELGRSEVNRGTDWAVLTLVPVDWFPLYPQIRI